VKEVVNIWVECTDWKIVEQVGNCVKLEGPKLEEKRWF
jgi:hypothetical protein